jgi:hypothetical protein
MSDTVIIRSLRIGDRARNCAGCAHWSQWLANTGDCMEYAARRRTAEGAHLPVLSARCTASGYVCDDFKPRAPEPRP